MIRYDSSKKEELSVFLFQKERFFWPPKGSDDVYLNYSLCINPKTIQDTFVPISPTMLVEWNES